MNHVSVTFEQVASALETQAAAGQNQESHEQIERGEFHTSEEVWARMEKLLKNRKPVRRQMSCE